MWNAISYVSSAVTLLAFIAAVIAAVLRTKILQKERLIKNVPEKDRAQLVERTLEFFSIDTASLTRGQRYDLALRQINARAARFRTTAIVTVIIAVLAAG